MKIYLVGDSHATELAQSWLADINKESERVVRKDLSLGLQTLYCGCFFGPVSDSFKASAAKLLNELERDSIIILSYTDVDGRISISEGKSKQRILEDYRLALDLFLQQSGAKKIFIIDWYSIENTKQSQQVGSSEERLENRRLQVDALNKLCAEFPIEIDSTIGCKDFESDAGFALPGIAHDGVHYDFSKVLISNILRPRFDDILNRAEVELK